MTDQTSSAPLLADAQPRSAQPPKREYVAYFALIFAATLPLALLTWALQLGRQMRLPEKGPIARAWSQARIITPKIFWA